MLMLSVRMWQQHLEKLKGEMFMSMLNINSYSVVID